MEEYARETAEGCDGAFTMGVFQAVRGFRNWAGPLKLGFFVL
uniref:Uncharacterized protein n=1 Tax=Paramormyrops kingsleyae TaxID=1676925 RepID=A0A3B3SDT7_9TELE